MTVYLSFFTDTSLILTASLVYAVMNERVTMNCTATKVTIQNVNITFYSNTTKNPIVTFSQKNNNCYAKESITPRFLPSCGVGTNNNSHTKIYTLVIERVEEQDFTDWWCQLDIAPVRSQSVTLKLCDKQGTYKSTHNLLRNAQADIDITLDLYLQINTHFDKLHNI